MKNVFPDLSLKIPPQLPLLKYHFPSGPAVSAWSEWSCWRALNPVSRISLLSTLGSNFKSRLVSV